jgi:hypothetical protein
MVANTVTGGCARRRAAETGGREVGRRGKIGPLWLPGGGLICNAPLLVCIDNGHTPAFSCLPLEFPSMLRVPTPTPPLPRHKSPTQLLNSHPFFFFFFCSAYSRLGHEFLRRILGPLDSACPGVGGIGRGRCIRFGWQIDMFAGYSAASPSLNAMAGYDGMALRFEGPDDLRAQWDAAQDYEFLWEGSDALGNAARTATHVIRWNYGDMLLTGRNGSACVSSGGVVPNADADGDAAILHVVMRRSNAVTRQRSGDERLMCC